MAFASLSLVSVSLMSSLLVIVAIAMWAIELQRKKINVPGATVLGTIRKTVLGRFAFEILGLAMCAVLVIFLCARQRHIGFESIPNSDDKLWQDITKEWPLLMTADSLLSIQSMIRVVMLLSALLRDGAAGNTALVPEAATFMLFASICRLGLIGLSPFDVYHLDGPLGGAVYVIFEVVAFPLLLLLSHRMVYQGARGIVVLASGALFSYVAASNQQFHLADDAKLDLLFSMALIFELPAAMSFLVRSCAAAVSTTEHMAKHSYACFTHFVLPVQQGLSLYFLLVGLAPPLETPESNIRVGHPFEFMWAAGAAQVVIYLLAAIVYLISSVDEPEVAPASEAFIVNV